MNTGLHATLSTRLFLAAGMTAPLFAPLASQAQAGNSAYGLYALYHDTTGGYNTADGSGSLYANTTGSFNTATGFDSLYLNTTGSFNTANGYAALLENTTGNYNTANGYYSLYFNKAGSYNTASGYQALCYNTGNLNTATGYQSLYNNTVGYINTAIGYCALSANTIGANNTALGYLAGSYNTTGSNNIAIGNFGAASDNGVIRIGTPTWHKSTFISGISGVTASGGVAVFINGIGQLGTLTSSRRFKNDIKDMGTITDKLMQLRPVTFRYKDTAESGSHNLQYGLIAEEVAKVYPDLVQYDKAGKPFTVYYHLLTPMLLNELQKEHRTNEAAKTEIAAMKAAHRADIAELKAAQKTEVAALKSELTSLQVAQEHQRQMLANLASYTQAPTNKGTLHTAALVHH